MHENQFYLGPMPAINSTGKSNKNYSMYTK